MQFGFSYVGLLFLLMLMVPNLVWTKNKPGGVYGKNICMLLSTVLLGIGHIGIHLNHRKEIS